MGIAGVEPRQLAPTVGTTGSGSTDSPAPSPTNAKIDINTTIDTVVDVAVLTVINNNAKIDIDTTINATVGIAVPAIIDANPAEPEVDIAGSTVIGTHCQAPPASLRPRPSSTLPQARQEQSRR
jgi:hypothetical protein